VIQRQKTTLGKGDKTRYKVMRGIDCGGAMSKTECTWKWASCWREWKGEIRELDTSSRHQD